MQNADIRKYNEILIRTMQLVTEVYSELYETPEAFKEDDIRYNKEKIP